MSEGVKVRPRNWVVPASLVALQEESSHGYQLMERLTGFGFEEKINPGTFYRALRQMESDGLCESEWEATNSGPARRIYSITSSGEAHLDLWFDSLNQYKSNIDAFLGLYYQPDKGI